MRNTVKKMAAFLLAVCFVLPALAGCHGSRILDPFVMPEELY